MTQVVDGWRGRGLGRPPSGPGSLAGSGRRAVALALDWALATLVARLVAPGPAGDPAVAGWVVLAVFAASTALLVGTAGATLGHRLLGVRVERAAGGWAGPVPALVRTLLLCLVVPAVVWDADQRGLHDRAAGTAVVRT